MDDATREAIIQRHNEGMSNVSRAELEALAIEQWRGMQNVNTNLDVYARGQADMTNFWRNCADNMLTAPPAEPGFFARVCRALFG